MGCAVGASVNFIQGNISRGDILECNFGNYKEITDTNGVISFDRNHYDSRIPFEIRKTRPVVVIGDHKGSYIVVPISTTEDTHKNPRKTGVARRYHVELRDGEMPVTHFYEAGVIRWAKANMIQAVDRRRLASIYCRNQDLRLAAKVNPETLKLVQEGVIRAIGCTALLG